ncbi:hypothetical protein [Sulfuracidifex metallicus]|nr:hypothetical protein [Sulfuracidifex metallicus]WOE51642.1 hypothetical protein RQ359_000962 [Sulfuracidifex metallicus DSM 6482 = JCM 9184]
MVAFRCKECKKRVEIMIANDGSLIAKCPVHGVIYKDKGDKND